ncbi:hypothetical protein OPQ81_004962 [Rhizoctonia solani]|nr:hypothetical protein OPQ81_004962 [Rhizoctonia solani]
MGLKKDLLKRMGELGITIPSAIQQCAIKSIVNGRNVLAQAPKDDGKTTSLALSIIQAVDTNIPHAQVLVLNQNKQAATVFLEYLLNLSQFTGISGSKCYLCDDDASIQADLRFAIERGKPIILGTPGRVLELLRCRILQTRHLKILAMDNVEDVIEAGFGDQVLDVRRYLPCSLQTVVTFTNSSPELIRIAGDLITDPLYITVEDNSVFFNVRHFFVVLPTATKRMDYLYSLRSGLNADRVIAFLRESEASEATLIANTLDSKYKPKHNNYNYGYNYTITTYDNYIMTSTMLASQCDQQMQYFLSSSKSTLITTDAATLTRTKIVNQPNIPLVHYHAPSNAKEYAKRLTYYGSSGNSTVVVTFIVAETNEIRVIREIEQHYGIQMVELHWDERSGWATRG